MILLRKISLKVYHINRILTIQLLHMLRLKNIKLYQNQKQNHYLLIRKEVILKTMVKTNMMIIVVTNFLTFLMLRQWYVEYVALNGNFSLYLVVLSYISCS